MTRGPCALRNSLEELRWWGRGVHLSHVEAGWRAFLLCYNLDGCLETSHWQCCKQCMCLRNG